jgi:N-acetyltransferase 10
MLVLQDFEAITPNVLARTVETVEGGGLVVLMLKTMTSLTQLYSLAMDVHSRFKTEAHGDVVGRFNERFLLSLVDCQACLVVDDELNVMPVTKTSQAPPTTPTTPITTTLEEKTESLRSLKESLAETQPIGTVLTAAKTLDQARALLTFAEAIADKTLRTTVALTAARGRGKSAALGLAMATAVAEGYAAIFVTSPSPENLGTLFDFVFRGFDALEYQEHADYEVVRSTHADFNKAVIRVNVTRPGMHRQTIQYIDPSDSGKLGQCELLVVDEAAAIPLPTVRALLGPYLVFLSSTVNGYEGTGRSLSLKLIAQLRQQSKGVAVERGLAGWQVARNETLVKEDKADAAFKAPAPAQVVSDRQFKEISMKDPIRYSPGDPVEQWLNSLLCLDTLDFIVPLSRGAPHPSECELFYVNRDTLFSYHRASEVFLQRVMALYVASHYKNSPNDLQLMSDAPAHHLFVLLGPTTPDQNTLPDVLCVIQVALEGEISKESVTSNLSRGSRPAGDLIPWNVSQQFSDSEFPSLSGARIVRIATHPDYQSFGYGTQAMKLLQEYYLTGGGGSTKTDPTPTTTPLSLKPRQGLPPLLARLSERPAERLHWLGTSYGLTLPLLKFWSRLAFRPIYLRLEANDITGEHSCIMLHQLGTEGEWLDGYHTDFKKRCLSLLGYTFSTFPVPLAIELLGGSTTTTSTTTTTTTTLSGMYSTMDIKRLGDYTRGLVDYHVILDLVPALARDFHLGRFPFHLSAGQIALLTAIGLQHKPVTAVASELNIADSQVLALFLKAMTRCYKALAEKESAEVLKELDSKKEKKFGVAAVFEKYGVRGGEQDWDHELQKKDKAPASVSIKRLVAVEADVDDEFKKRSKKKSKKDH